MEPGRTSLPQLRRGVLESCVLALLQPEPRYGFDLVRTLSGTGLLTSEGTIYPLLARLRKEGLVETTWRESATGPPRRYYSATPAGAAALAAFTAEWTQFRDGVDAVLDAPSPNRSTTDHEGREQ